MNEVEKNSQEIQPTSLNFDEIKKEFNVDEIVDFFINENFDRKSTLISGRVYQKNKKHELVDVFFKLITEEIKKIQSKNNRDLDNSLFNLNKKILLNNVDNIKEIIKIYNIDEERIAYFIIGTLIQYIYESRS